MLDKLIKILSRPNHFRVSLEAMEILKLLRSGSPQNCTCTVQQFEVLVEKLADDKINQQANQISVDFFASCSKEGNPDKIAKFEASIVKMLESKSLKGVEQVILYLRGLFVCSDGI